MKIEQLKYFLEAARQEHIGKAANVVAITPSAISHSIAALERELGRELFVKRGKNIFITNHGKLLMEKAERFLNDIESIKDEIASDQVEMQGHYRLAGTHGMGAVNLVRAWSVLQETHPQLTVEVYTRRSVQVIRGVADGEYDFGVCYSPQPHPRIEAKQIFKGELYLAVRKDHPILRLPSAKIIEGFSRYPAALPKAFQGVDNCESHPIFEKLGIIPRPAFISDSYELAVAKILSSNAWGLLPCVVIKERRDLVPVIPKGWHAPYNVSAIWPKHRTLTRVLKRLMTDVESTIRRNTKAVMVSKSVS